MSEKEQISKEVRDISEAKVILEAKVPSNLIKVRKQAGQSLSYVSGNFVIDQLNRAFGYLWDFKIDRSWIQESIPKKTKNYDTGQTTEVPQPPVAHVACTITAYVKAGDRIIPISKSAHGSKVLLGGAQEQESCFKSAQTDALKKAASLFGVAAQLYRDDSEQDYFETQSVMSSWTPEEEEKRAADFSYIVNMKKKYNMDDTRVNGMVQRWSQNMISGFNKLTPDKLTEFVAYLKEQEAAAAAQKAQ